MTGSAGWWRTKVRQFMTHVGARVDHAERDRLAGWLSPAQLAVFDAMHVADQRHGLDVVRSLREQGVTEDEVLLAGLLHDAGKGDTGLWPRVAWSLGEAWGPWVWRLASIVPGMGTALDRLRDHADTSAGLAARAGCTPRTVDLIRHQDSPHDAEFGELLRLADEAN